MIFCIYGLFDPQSKELRYVGFTGQKLRTRLTQHCSPNRLKSHSHKNSWIKLLKSKNIEPEIVLLEEYFNKNDALEAEIDLIAYFKSIGCNLLNRTDGGDEGVIYERTPDVCNKISKKSKGRRHTEESKIKISNSLKGKSKPPRTPEWKEKLRQANLGKKIPDEVKRKQTKNNPKTKLNKEIIANILELNKTKKYSQKKLGEIFGVHSSHICRIINGKLGKYLP